LFRDYSAREIAVVCALNVPFAKKDEAKALGARWDPKAKSWWLPERASAKSKDQARKLGFMD